MDNSENIQLQSRRLAPKLGSVPLSWGHLIPGGTVSRSIFLPRQGNNSLIFGDTAPSTPPPPIIKRKERKYIVLVKALVAQSRTRVT